MALLLVAFVAGCGGGGSGSSAPSSAKAFTAYSLAGITGTRNETSTPKTIVVTVRSGTNVSALVATFSAPGASVTVSGVAQTSGVTANNFTSPVVYMVTAADGTTAIYAVTVVPNPAIIAFSLAGVKGTIDETAKTIAVTVPYVTNVTSLAAAFTATGTGTGVTAVGVAQTSGVTMNDFTNSVAYTAIATDGTTATYTVTVTRALNPNKTITSYSLDGIPGTIDPTNPTISVPMPYGKNITALVATFTTTGASVKVGSLEQQSLVTTNDFTNPVAYTVTAVDGTTTTYTVTVNQALSSDKAITSYALAGATGTITGGASPFAIAVTVPIGTNLTGLAATFVSTAGASVKVGGLDQVSAPAGGATLNDFSNSVASPVAYVVTAADSTTATYNVTVTASPGPNLGTAANFAVLAGTALTTVAPNLKTTVTGDVGATTESITTNGTLAINAGTDWTGTATYTTAMSDLATAISDANNATLFPCGGISITGAIGTTALTPGIYCLGSTGTDPISGVVILTLNGPGVFIFRTTGALAPQANSSVVFGPGANDTNTTVFWVVGSASLGSPATWMGTILTGGAITLGDGDTLEKGRVLSTAAVNLTNNTITKP